MSRLGKLPVKIPDGTEVTIQNDFVAVKGPQGELRQTLHRLVKAAVVTDETGRSLTVSVDDPENKKQRALWGLHRMLLQNMVSGVNSLFEKKLEVNGVGYKAAASGQTLTLQVGYSHPVVFTAPEGIAVTVEKNIVTVRGIDKQAVGETAAKIRQVRPPEPYKGKGIKYVDEVLRRKAGKTASSS